MSTPCRETRRETRRSLVPLYLPRLPARSVLDGDLTPSMPRRKLRRSRVR